MTVATTTKAPTNCMGAIDCPSNAQANSDYASRHGASYPRPCPRHMKRRVKLLAGVRAGSGRRGRRGGGVV
jgi:hypothetical protein